MHRTSLVAQFLKPKHLRCFALMSWTNMTLKDLTQDDDLGRFQGSFEPVPLASDIGTCWQVLPGQDMWLDTKAEGVYNSEAIRLTEGYIFLLCDYFCNHNGNKWCVVLYNGSLWTCHWETLYYACQKLP
jgi:hypothetical protein